MHSRIYDAVRDAMSLVRKSNVKDATAVIRAALTGGEADLPHSPATSALKRLGFGTSQPPQSYTEDLDEANLAPARKQHDAVKQASRRSRQSDKTTGNFTSRMYHHVERNLDYMLYVPPEQNSRPKTVLLMLHGCTQNPTDFARGTQMNTLADEFNLIVAYPLQPKTANSSGCWNWFDARHQKHGSGEPAMLAGLAEHLRQEFSVAENRVFVAGLSAGGAMAEVLATTYPAQFSAVGVHSGLPYGAARSVGSAFKAMRGSSKTEHSSATKTSIRTRRIIFHGSGDATVHPSNGERIVSQAIRNSEKLAEIKFTSEINGRSVVRTIFEKEDDASMIEYWVIEGGGHAWSGGSEQGSFADPKGPDASREMVRFFLHG